MFILPENSTHWLELTVIYVRSGTSYLRSRIYPTGDCFMVVLLDDADMVGAINGPLTPGNRFQILQDSVPLFVAVFSRDAQWETKIVFS